MTTLMARLGVDRLAPDDRIRLALELWESLAEDRQVSPLRPEQRAELARRDAELQADPSRARTWAQIRAAVEGER